MKIRAHNYDGIIYLKIPRKAAVNLCTFTLNINYNNSSPNATDWYSLYGGGGAGEEGILIIETK